MCFQMYLVGDSWIGKPSTWQIISAVFKNLIPQIGDETRFMSILWAVLKQSCILQLCHLSLHVLWGLITQNSNLRELLVYMIQS